MVKRILLIAVCLLLSAGIIHTTIRSAYRQAYQEEQEEAQGILRRQKEELERELKEVEDSMEQVVIGKGSVVLVFERLDRRLYDEALPIMKEFGFNGVMALSPDSLPDMEGCIRSEEFRELLDLGWTTCVYWDDFRTLERTLKELCPELERLSIDLPKAVAVAKGSYQTYKDEELEAAGFTVVLQHGDEGQLIARSDTETLLRMGAVWWNHSAVLDVLSATAEYGGAVAISVDFFSRYGDFEGKLFRNMCQSLKNLEETLEICDLDRAREKLFDVKGDDYLNKRAEYLQGEIQRIEKEMEAVYQLDREAVAAAKSE